MNVHVHIHELALMSEEVWPIGHSYSDVREGFAAALGRLLAERGVPESWSEGVVTAPARPLSIALDRPTDPRVLAERLAVAVYEGLGG